MHFSTPLLPLALLLSTSTVLASPVAAPAPAAAPLPAELVAQVDCSSTSCKKLVNEGSCLIDAGSNIIKILKCLSDAGGVSNVCPCIACLPGKLGDVLSSPGIC